jgi:hypothetical protein
MRPSDCSAGPVLEGRLPLVNCASPPNRPSDEAIRPPTFTVAEAPNTKPLGLISHTWPLAFKVPKMLEGLFW